MRARLRKQLQRLLIFEPTILEIQQQQQQQQEQHKKENYHQKSHNHHNMSRYYYHYPTENKNEHYQQQQRQHPQELSNNHHNHHILFQRQHKIKSQQRKQKQQQKKEIEKQKQFHQLPEQHINDLLLSTLTTPMSPLPIPLPLLTTDTFAKKTISMMMMLLSPMQQPLRKVMKNRTRAGTALTSFQATQQTLPSTLHNQKPVVYRRQHHNKINKNKNNKQNETGYLTLF